MYTAPGDTQIQTMLEWTWHLFSKHLLKVCYVPDFIIGIEDRDKRQDFASPKI